MSTGPSTARREPPATRTAAAATDPLQQAYALFARRQWSAAEPLCRGILERQPDHPGALTLLGIMMAQTGRGPEAVGLFERAVRCTPNNAEAHNNLGSALRDLGRSRDALSCYERAVALEPGYAEAHYNRGVALHELKDNLEALVSYDRAIALRPDYAAAWNNRGTVLRDLARFDEALQSYERAIAARADYAAAHNNRGATLHRLERYEEALASIDRALGINPQYAEAHANRGAALSALGRHDPGLESLERAISLKPDHAEAHANRGAVLNALGRYEEALQSHDRAIVLMPDYGSAHNNRGASLHQLGRHEEALQAFARAIAIEPRNAQPHANRGVTLCALRRYEEAVESFERAAAIEPRLPDTHFELGSALYHLKRFPSALASLDRARELGRRDAALYCNRADVLGALGRSEEAIESYERALELAAPGSFLRGECCHARMKSCEWRGFEPAVVAITAAIERDEPVIMPFSLLSLLDAPVLQRRATEVWVREKLRPKAPPPPLPRRPRHEKIRLGYFSADLRNHAVAILTAGLFEAHDRSRFEVTAFALGSDTRDELRMRVEAAFDRFLPVDGLSDPQIVALAREHEIDIAIDLGGYTHDSRSGIFALRAAPIQVSYLGYLGTMAAEFIDYLIADPVLVPAQSRQHYSEKIAYLPSYQVNDSKRPLAQRTLARAELGLPATGFVFCSFNASYKITPDTFDSWMRILTAVPQSVLFLLGSSATAERNLRREASARGVAPERLVFGRSLPFADYLARYGAADLFLDTLPYNAGTTASDALWAGLPVLTCPGESFAARMAASLLTAAGLPELITADRPHYERLAIELATDPQRLAHLKQKLADNRPRCPLFDTAATTRNIEALYRQMYDRLLAGLPPQHLFCSDNLHGQG
jgi:predicted O-linked N-acetylglucosamine transferase (SPINDLY family)